MQGKIKISLVGGFLITAAAMGYLDSFLKSYSAPWGIVSYELAYNATQVQMMLNEWARQGQVAAAIGLGLDFLFIPLYCSVMWMITTPLVRNAASRWVLRGSMFVSMYWLIPVAGVLDVVENLGLMRALLIDVNEHWVMLSSVSAHLKFFVLAVWGNVAFVLWLALRKSKSSKGFTPNNGRPIAPQTKPISR